MRRGNRVSVIGILTVLLVGTWACQSRQEKAAPASQTGTLDRTVLPIPEPDYPHETELDARKATAPPRFEVKPPAGAPNVLIVLIDDMGFGIPSAFGGPINMPTVDRLASAGLRYNQFHTTALCAPTRLALLTGRNHHMNNMGSITETATAFPGNTGQRPNNVAPLAEMLRLNGYSTGFFGKNHETAPWEVLNSVAVSVVVVITAEVSPLTARSPEVVTLPVNSDVPSTVNVPLAVILPPVDSVTPVDPYPPAKLVSATPPILSVFTVLFKRLNVVCVDVISPPFTAKSPAVVMSPDDPVMLQLSAVTSLAPRESAVTISVSDRLIAVVIPPAAD